MDHTKNRFKLLKSVNFLFIIVLLTIIFFNVFDIIIFKASRDLSSIFFWFFNNIVNAIAGILDPLNFGILLISILFLTSLLSNIIKEPNKKKLILEKIECSELELKESIIYYKLVISHCIFSIIMTGIVCHLLKYILGASRPKYFFLYDFERIDNFNLEHKVNALPSGHTQASFTLAILFYLYSNRYLILVFLLASLIALSRIFLSMHFPSDLILGGYLGAVFPIIIYINMYKKKFIEIDVKKIIKIKTFFKFLWYKIYV